MKQKAYLLIALLCSFVQGAWAWDGSGTSADPYLIKNSADWKQLADDVVGGESYSGKFFEMTADIDAEGISVGASDKPFSGTISGGMHTLTYNAGTISRYTEGLHAPFVLLKGAAIKDLKVVGAIYSKSKYSAGLACFVDGAKTTTVSGCHVSTQINGSYDVNADANFGGFVAYVKSTSSNPLTFTNCSFQGYLGDFSAGSACFVGFTRVPVSIEHCVVDPLTVFQGIANTATFVRAADGVNCTLKECYYTQAYGAEQGQGVFKSVEMPKGCTAEIVGEPTLRFNDVNYYGAGTKVSLTVPEGTQFDHWTTEGKPVGCFISDPWTASGIHTIYDIRTQPKLSIATSLPASPQSNRQRYGINYRYLSNNDYKLFMSDSLFQARGYRFDKDGLCYFYDVDGTMTYLTAVWNCDANAETFQNYYRGGWFKDKDYEGCIIENDLVSDAWEHTHLFAISPRAFLNVKNLKRIIFKSDIDPTFRDNATVGLDVAIQEQAFKGSGLEELVMMYRNEKTSQWEVLDPTTGMTIAADAFEGTSAQISVDPSVYQSFMGDKKWSAHRNRFGIYAAKVEDMKVNGAVYSYWRDNQGQPVKNSGEGNQAMMETLKYWNADYQEFTASSLLSTSSENIWYSQVIGVDASSLDNGTMRIYNDPGSYYNYKTIALESLGQSKDVKSIEFWQTNGRSDNSLTDMKMVIRNGALKGCDNLKEIRMFYYLQDGDDRWGALGPKDVIPGDDIFGIKAYEELDMSDDANKDAYAEALSKMQNVRICVSANRYQEFLDDSNWLPYQTMLVPQDGPDTQVKADFKKEGVTYGYMTSPGGILQTSQTVSQDVSWWTVPRIALEVALTAASMLDNCMSKETAKKLNVDELIKNIDDLTDDVLAKSDYIERLDYNKTLLADFKQALDFNDARLASSDVQKKFIADFAGKETKDLALSKANLKVLNKLHLVSNGKIVGEEELAQMFKQELISDVDGVSACFALSASNTKMIKVTKSAMKVIHNQLDRTINSLPFYLDVDPFEEPVWYVVREAFEDYKRSLPNAFQQIFTGRGMPGHSSALFSTIAANSIYATNFYGSGNYNVDDFQKGMRANILSNMHQVGLVGGGYIITTPQKNLAYHTYIKDVPDETTVTLYAGTDEGGRNSNTTTAAIARDVFKGKKSVRTVQFHESEVTTNEAVPMVMVIPDSIFAGTSVHTLDLRLKTNENGTQAMGPESFILAGSNTFAGVDSTRFQIIIDPSRKNDFRFNESWAPYERFFTYESAAPKSRWNDYGAWYGLAYENGSVQKVHKESGHRIDHTLVTEPDDSFLERNSGGLKLCNDIGIWNNYQLDAVVSKAFYGNKKLTTVNFTDLPDMNTGDCYTGLNVTLQDSCFANSSLKYLEMLYLVTDGTNHIDAITPQQVKIGQGVLDGTKAKIKMMPQQVSWFEADSSWVKYKDRFMPCIIQPTDAGFKKALEDATYYDRAHTDGDTDTWDDYADLSRVEERGFYWLRDKLKENKDDILSLADYKHFESVGMESIGEDMFNGLSKMTNIVLPTTVKRVLNRAFEGCSALQEIEIPAKVDRFFDDVFNGCKDLKTIRVLNPTPASLGDNVFPKNKDMRIYVPAESLDAYLTAWAEYKNYIVSDANYRINKVVDVETSGTLADKLGLYVEWSYSGLAAGDEPRYIHGNYAKYDSLTIRGQLNDLDLWVIRYLAGNNGYDRRGSGTDGCLHYLNLYDASIVKDSECKAHYLNMSPLVHSEWYNITNSDVLPTYLFYNCTALETVILPKSIKEMEARIFAGCSALKRVAITGALKKYDSWEYKDGLLDYPLDELVILTDSYATTSSNDPWGAALRQVYTFPSLIGDYMNDISMITNAQAINAPFKDDRTLDMLAIHNDFFPSEYLASESVEGIFGGSHVEDFDDFDNFRYVKRLENTFEGAADLRRISLPASVEYIGRKAFAKCVKLDTIRVCGIEPAELAEDAFRDLPADFRILVPRRYAKLYRTQWAQYADHINADDTYMANDDILTVTVTEPNTLAKALGLEATTHEAVASSIKYLIGVRGDYSRITKLKVVGPIGAVDIDLMKYLAGYCSWAQSRNYTGHLEYIDLYDAQIKHTDESSAVWGEYKRWDGTATAMGYSVEDNLLPQHSFLRAHSLKTLILPKTCKKVSRRALQECESLETLVIGDDMEDFNWSALDDDAMLTRMYILANKKPEISSDFPIWRWLCNNYNPTFDAFYVRPSQYQSYLQDDAYTGSSWQRTNNISTGVFDDDDSFCAFASRGTATQDELATITNVDGWFDYRPGIKNLTPLKYTSVDSLSKATLAPLTELEQMAMPAMLTAMEDKLFENNKKLRYVDFLSCKDDNLIHSLAYTGMEEMGLNRERTLLYMPASYGYTGEDNVVVAGADKMCAQKYYLIDSLDYMVPYSFETEAINNDRKLEVSDIPYTVCVPYNMSVPRGAKAYKLSERDGNTLVFTEETDEMLAMHPYLLKVEGNKGEYTGPVTLDALGYGAQTIPSNKEARMQQDDAPGYSMRGTFSAISNAEAADLGAYILQSDGDWHPVSTSNQKASILPFRAYLLPSARNAMSRIGMQLGDNATGIDSFTTIDTDGTERTYDLQGREINARNAKGVVIINGRKVIKK